MFRSLLFKPADAFDVDQDEDGALVVRLIVAESPNGERIVTADCALHPMDELGAYEFAFAITCTDIDNNELPFGMQDRFLALRLIPPDARPHVMPSVCNALGRLVDEVRPDAIYRVSKFPDLPEKAMAKHRLITSCLPDMDSRIEE